MVSARREVGRRAPWRRGFGFRTACGPAGACSGQRLLGHLLDASFHGPQWLTGGPMGPKASALVFVVMAAAFAAFHLRFREVRFRPPEPGPGRAEGS